MRILASDPVLAVHDLARSGTWYAEVLGADVSPPESGDDWLFCRASGVTFMLGRCPDVVPAADIGDHSYVAYLRVEGVDAFHDRAVAAGAQILRPPTDQPWGMREMALRSPDGHRLMLGQPV
jgi:predicted enzyme related to lactoylglutathione lyase